MDYKSKWDRPWILRFIENVIFSSKWILLPFYLGLFVVMGLYLKEFCHDLWNMLHMEHTKESILLTALEMVDIVMIANLIKMIITGSYNSFIDKTHGKEGGNVSSGLLKVKMGTSLIGVSSIHLLQVFIETGIHPKDWNVVNQQLAIHGMFLVGAAILAWIELLHVKGEKIHSDIKH